LFNIMVHLLIGIAK